MVFAQSNLSLLPEIQGISNVAAMGASKEGVHPGQVSHYTRQAN